MQRADFLRVGLLHHGLERLLIEALAAGLREGAGIGGEAAAAEALRVVHERALDLLEAATHQADALLRLFIFQRELIRHGAIRVRRLPQQHGRLGVVLAVGLLLGKLHEARRLLERNYVNVGEGMVVLPEDVRIYSRSIEGLPEHEQELFLPRLLTVALNRLGATGRIQDAAEAVRDECEFESSSQEAKLSMVRFTAWAIPAVGFVGTVRGIGAALAMQFAKSGAKGVVCADILPADRAGHIGHAEGVLLAAVGAINWGVTAFTSKAGKSPMNLVDKVLKPKSAMMWVPSDLAKIVYILIAAAGAFVLYNTVGEIQKGYMWNY